MIEKSGSIVLSVATANDVSKIRKKNKEKLEQLHVKMLT